jgi:hypothetical protein
VKKGRFDPFGHPIALTIIHKLSFLQTLLVTVKIARDMDHLRDNETGTRLERVSHSVRLPANKFADKYQLSHEYVEGIFIFAPAQCR